MIYHGSCIPGLHTIKANSRSHSTGKLVAYFSVDRCYALVCCRSRAENFVTMGVGADGRQHYFERFPNQLETLYKDRKGYLYFLDSADGMIRGKGRSWESEHDVPVAQCEIMPMCTVKFCGKKLWGIWLSTDILRWIRQNRRDTQIISRTILWMKGRKWQNSTAVTFLLYGIDHFHCKSDAPRFRNCI